MRLLVAGADRVDAGKTTFSTGLCDRIDGTGFKPRAGNDYWFDHDDCLAALEEGRLYGKDARRLAAASDADVRPEEINPVHRLWRPARTTEGGLIGREGRQFVLDRVDGAFVRNAGAEVPERVAAALPLSEATTVETVRELNALTRERYLPAFDALADRIAATDRAVVESYGDVASPLSGLAVDAVAVVEPGGTRVYDGERWATACEVASGSAGTDPGAGSLEQRVGDLEGHLSAVAEVDLPPLTGEERADPGAVADAYEVAYDAVLAAAVE
jgi:predicted P-loop ATPase/GTPase